MGHPWGGLWRALRGGLGALKKAGERAGKVGAGPGAWLGEFAAGVGWDRHSGRGEGGGGGDEVLESGASGNALAARMGGKARANGKRPFVFLAYSRAFRVLFALEYTADHVCYMQAPHPFL